MKIAVPCQGENLDAPMDSRFGRASAYLIYDSETKDIKILPNEEAKNAPGGAGVLAGGIVAESGAEVLISGNVGPRAFDVLTQAGVKVYMAVFKTVREAIEAYQKGQLPESEGANKPGRWN